MKNIIFKFIMILALPIFLIDYFRKRTGQEYGVGFFKKLALILKMYRNTKKIVSLTYFLEHLVMVSTILKIPKNIEGCVVECGCYKGASTANLSLVCSLCNRQLEVFDSFEGLPEPSNHDKEHVVLSNQEIHSYARGDFRGIFEEVKSNISRYGDIKVCNFNAGYFEDTLPQFTKNCVFIFLDVDLKDSLETCLKNLWLLLQDNCYLFTHEAPHIIIASLFFNEEWWRKNLNCAPPGLIGAGNGLGLIPDGSGFRSDIGYTIKHSQVMNLKKVEQTC